MEFILEELSQIIKEEVKEIKEGTKVRIAKDPETQIDDKKHIVVYLYSEEIELYDNIAENLVNIIRKYNRNLIATFNIYDGKKHHMYGDIRII